jgi:ABC-type Zn2+ transport system substrate-binding protein/surface adhesin
MPPFLMSAFTARQASIDRRASCFIAARSDGRLSRPALDDSIDDEEDEEAAEEDDDDDADDADDDDADDDEDEDEEDFATSWRAVTAYVSPSVWFNRCAAYFWAAARAMQTSQAVPP